MGSRVVIRRGERSRVVMVGEPDGLECWGYGFGGDGGGDCFWHWGQGMVSTLIGVDVLVGGNRSQL